MNYEMRLLIGTKSDQYKSVIFLKCLQETVMKQKSGYWKCVRLYSNSKGQFCGSPDHILRSGILQGWFLSESRNYSVSKNEAKLSKTVTRTHS